MYLDAKSGVDTAESEPRKEWANGGAPWVGLGELMLGPGDTQGEPPFHGRLNIALQGLGCDPAAIGQLKPTAITAVATGVAQKDQGIPGATRIEGRFQGAKAGLLTAVDLQLDLPAPFERLQLLQFLFEVKALLLADPNQQLWSMACSWEALNQMLLLLRAPDRLAPLQ